jgi:beta-lactamase regulating signal transducer with metallopeptidase domain
MMDQDLGYIFAFNIIVNSILTFFTLSAIVALFVFIFRVKSPRYRALLLCVPILKIAIDLFSYDFSSWALTHHIDPLQTEQGTRRLYVGQEFIVNDTYEPSFGSRPVSFLAIPKTNIQFFLTDGHRPLTHTHDGKSFTIADIIAKSIDIRIVKTLVVIVSTISLALFIIWLRQLYQSFQWIQDITKNADKCERPIYNLSLNRALTSSKVQLLTSSSIATPCAVGFFQKHILFPEGLSLHLTQEEFEAIVAHELSHLRWHDCIIRIFNDSLGTLFWWIPIKLWARLINHSQELACDASIDRFQCSKDDMASAIYQAAKFNKNRCLMIPALTFIGNTSSTHRVKSILHRKKSSWLTACIHFVLGACVCYEMISLLCGKFFTF